jgi:hypothetical protein
MIMYGSWWLLWWVFLLVFLLPPVGYGWGYRRWGPPYPSYFQRRRAEQAGANVDTVSFNHYSWSWGGDLLWVGFLVAVVWSSALWWR